MENLKIYNAVRSVPAEAKKKIQGGRMNGKSDINPMWRIKALTEQFGPVGFGWYYDILEKGIIDGADGEKISYVDIALYVKIGDEWSKPIHGTGGNSLVAKEKNGLYTNDECFKMALTDAISVACKALGVGADVYWELDPTRYSSTVSTDAQSDVQQAIESELLAKVKSCTTIPELNEFFRQHRSSFMNQNILVQACTNRKNEINGAA